MPRPRIARRLSVAPVARFVPSKLMALPVSMRPGGRMSRRIERAVTDLPLPDSPTMPSVSPGSTWNERPSTARARPALVGNTVRRSRIERSGCSCAAGPVMPSLPRISRFAQAVADGIDGDHGEDDGESGKDRQPPEGAHLIRAVLHDVPPTRERRLHADAEEGEAGLEEHDLADAERRGDDDRGRDIGEEMLEEQPRVGGTERARGGDPLARADAQDLAADEPAHPEPTRESEDEHERAERWVAPEGADGQEQ